MFVCLDSEGNIPDEEETECITKYAMENSDPVGILRLRSESHSGACASHVLRGSSNTSFVIVGLWVGFGACLGESLPFAFKGHKEARQFHKNLKCISSSLHGIVWQPCELNSSTDTLVIKLVLSVHHYALFECFVSQ